jgi:hypothetical protein
MMVLEMKTSYDLHMKSTSDASQTIESFFWMQEYDGGRDYGSTRSRA